MTAITKQTSYRLLNVLIPFLVPLALSCFLIAPTTNGDKEKLLDWFLEAAFWLFCGPIPLLVSATGCSLQVNVAVSIVARLLTLAPFVLHAPSPYEVSRTRLGINIGITVTFAALGFLWLIGSGV